MYLSCFCTSYKHGKICIETLCINIIYIILPGTTPWKAASQMYQWPVSSVWSPWPGVCRAGGRGGCRWDRPPGWRTPNTRPPSARSPDTEDTSLQAGPPPDTASSRDQLCDISSNIWQESFHSCTVEIYTYMYIPDLCNTSLSWHTSLPSRRSSASLSWVSLLLLTVFFTHLWESINVHVKFCSLVAVLIVHDGHCCCQLFYSSGSLFWILIFTCLHVTNLHDIQVKRFVSFSILIFSGKYLINDALTIWILKLCCVTIKSSFLQ